MRILEVAQLVAVYVVSISILACITAQLLVT